MAKYRFTLSSYDPVYAVAPEVKIPEEAVKQQALRWLAANVCKQGEQPRLDDRWVNSHVDGIKNVDELLIFIRYNMYRENREVQQLADQDVICRVLAERLVEDLPREIVDEAVNASSARLEDMLYRNGLTKADFCKQRKITEKKLMADVRERAIESIREDSALAAYADHCGYTLTPDDFYAVIPGDSIQDKARKRQQIELDGRLPGLEEYALKTKALKEVMENAMIKRRESDPDYVRYGDASADVLNANEQFPDNFVSM